MPWPWDGMFSNWRLSVDLLVRSRVSLILRAQGSAGYYRLVGAAYLHGFIEGEPGSPDITGVTPGEMMDVVVLV